MWRHDNEKVIIQKTSHKLNILVARNRKDFIKDSNLLIAFKFL